MRKLVSWVIFISSLVSLLISMRLFLNLGVFVDEYNLSPDIVYGGDFWLYMSWLRIGLLLIITIVSGNSIFKENKN